ncbi:MAG: hypothetical protein ACP5GA_08040, partial [Acidithiobacillus sp.]
AFPLWMQTGGTAYETQWRKESRFRNPSAWAVLESQRAGFDDSFIPVFVQPINLKPSIHATFQGKR